MVVPSVPIDVMKVIACEKFDVTYVSFEIVYPAPFACRVLIKQLLGTRWVCSHHEWESLFENAGDYVKVAISK
jgi:hypothetical protein